MKFHVLGPLEITHNGRTVAPSAAKDRAFLGELLAHPGQLISTEHIADALWPDRLPVDPANAVQVRASRLRGTLRSLSGDDDAGVVLRTRSGGYALELDQVTTDLADFEAALHQAENEPATATAVLPDALARWRGAPFADVPPTPCVLVQAARAEELRLTTVELYADVCLGEGTLPAALLADLAELAAHNPLREPLQHRLMRVLRMSGRPAEALTVYDRLRTTLADELGTDPHPDLRRLHQEILAEQPAPDPPAGSGARSDARSGVRPDAGSPGSGVRAAAAASPPAGETPPGRYDEAPAEQDGTTASSGGDHGQGPPAAGSGPVSPGGRASSGGAGTRARRRWLVAVGIGLVAVAGMAGAALVRLSEPPMTLVPDALRPIPGDDSRLDADVTYPDGTKVKTGSHFEKVWRFANTGTVSWHDRYLDRTQPWDGPDLCHTPRRVRIPDTDPGQTVLIRVPVTAPATPGRCKVYWKMVDERGIPFMPQLRGVFFDVQVVSDL